ncbi:ATP-binding response regulator [Azospirillum soli]|uniref:ATP-binding response regulator n=1 Tax=Azospirillum soli TaxID=1304799 RepID=UPI001AE79AE6|nr:response regulator [Azospirillum soli]MBP2313236.1 signal transduction histidine kinase/CheY-like chemotaxis protein [Azospirillum soli]
MGGHEGGATLVFDSQGRLAAWDEAAAALPGAAGRLANGAPSDALAPLFADRAVTDLPLSGGGFLRRVGARPASGPPENSPPENSRMGADLSGRLFAAASHDLRQPLAALSLLLGALEGRITEGRNMDGRAGGVGSDPVTRDLLASMGNAIQSMKGMVDGHFDLVRLQAGLMQPDVGSPVLNGILMRLALDAAPRFDAQGLRFSVMPCSVRVRTDPTLLERILQGFVADALRRTVRGRIVIGGRRRGGDLRIELWDTGRVLPPEQLRALREELQRPDGDGPLDLGLRLARGLARRLGHRLEVDWVEGRGTMFAVVVPQADESEDDPSAFPAQDSGAPERNPDVSLARVLVIEDDPMVLDALGALLGQWGCAVIGAESYDAALDRLGPSPQAPDLVISDLRLKGAANGIVAIRQIAKALNADLPGLILTGDTDPMRLREARLSGYPLLHKPVAPLALRAAVARLLGRERLKS